MVSAPSANLVIACYGLSPEPAAEPVPERARPDRAQGDGGLSSVASRDELYAKFGIATEAAQLFETERGTLLLCARR